MPAAHHIYEVDVTNKETIIFINSIRSPLAAVPAIGLPTANYFALFNCSSFLRVSGVSLTARDFR